jgi:hypothetical protein
MHARGVGEVEPAGDWGAAVADGGDSSAVVARVDADVQGEPGRPGDRPGRRHPVHRAGREPGTGNLEVNAMSWVPVRLMDTACRAAHSSSVIRPVSVCPVGRGLSPSARGSQATASNQACAVTATG